MPDFSASSLVPDIDSPDMRHAGRDALSLALMDSRNHTLQLLGLFEAQSAADPAVLWHVGHVAWYQDWWIGRNLRRSQGVRMDPESTRLASGEPDAEAWWDGRTAGQPQRVDLPSGPRLRSYALQTLETTLELLERAEATDDALYFFRQALFHEDMHAEQLLMLAQMRGMAVNLPAPAPQVVREPVFCAAQRWMMGSDDQGFSFDNERPAHPVTLPEFEIDAQAVTWSQFVEFVIDGGYDREELWQPAGWQWLQHQASQDGRRGPRYVDQIGVASGAVQQTRFGQPMRMLGNQSACHITWWEADAWCRWAGRRLPSEVEWEVAAHTARSRGFRWGEVWEWTGTTFRGYPGFEPAPDRDWSAPDFASDVVNCKVMRGASFATRARLKHPKLRNWAQPDEDAGFVGFRSCAF